MRRMGDGPVDNLPAGLDAYGGYVNRSGIGITFPGIVAKFPTAIHFSFTTDGSSAQCADVEKGAMSSWAGYDYGYCSVSNANAMIARFGRPRRLLTAHQDPRFGAHICSPACWPGLVTTADGTQWIDHGGLWDESLLNDDFFDPNPVPPTKEQIMHAIVINGVATVYAANPLGHLLEFSKTPQGWSVDDVTAEIQKLNPGTQPFLVQP